MAMMDWIQEHPDLSLAGGVVAVLLIAGSFIKGKLPGGATPPVGDTSGLTNGIVYVPTQTSFTTNNRQQQGIFASNDPLLTSVTSGPVNSPTTTTTETSTSTTTTNPPPAGHTCPSGTYWNGSACVPIVRHTGPLPRQTPPPGPPPPPTGGKHLIWDTRRSVHGGETLSSIAAEQTRYLRSKGMPGSMSISWHDLYGHNTDLIEREAREHGHRSDYWNWIFPGETLTVPRWG